MLKNKSFYILLCVALCGVFFSQNIQVQAKEISFHKEIYHQHSGDSAGGGCYTEQHKESIEVEVPCGGYIHYWPKLGTSQCSECGASYYGDQSGRDCWHTIKESKEHTYYSVGCGMSEGTALGNLYLQQSTDEWTKSLYLTGSYDVISSMSVSSKPYIWNGAAATENNSMEVTENGLYSLRLNADGNANTAAATISVDIKNIDHSGPSLQSYTLNPKSEWIREGVELQLGEILDLQPGGEMGCGLHETAISYDGGMSWTNEKSHFYTENGSHKIYLRDNLENTTVVTVEFHHIDHCGPTIEKLDYDDTKNIIKTVITVEAKDLQEDWTEGCGLAEEPYSFDGGKNWTKENAMEINRNGKVELVVRDALNNQTRKEIIINNLDYKGPEISYEMKPQSWTNQDVSLTLSAKDLQEDGSEGIGLPREWFSVNGGPWSDDADFTFESNTTLNIEARDLNDNRSEIQIVIDQIDKDLPWVELSMELVKNGENSYVMLRGKAGDDLSGLADKAYSWNQGKSYGTDPTFKVTENGIYQLTVRDKASNWRYKQIKVDCLQKEVKPVIIKKETGKKVAEQKLTVSENQIRKETKKVLKEPLIEKATEIQQKELKKPLWPLLLTVILLLLLLGLLLSLLFFFLDRLILIYGWQQDNYRLIGASFLKKEEDLFVISISDACIADCISNEMMLKPSKFFVFRHKDEMLNILLPEDQSLLKNIEKEIKFEMTCY